MSATSESLSTNEYTHVCTDRLRGVIYCNNETKDVFLSIQFCMTYDEEND